MIKIQGTAGEHISKCAKRACDLADAGTSVLLEFNDIMLTVTPGMTTDEVCAEFTRQKKRANETQAAADTRQQEKVRYFPYGPPAPAARASKLDRCPERLCELEAGHDGLHRSSNITRPLLGFRWQASQPDAPIEKVFDRLDTAMSDWNNIRLPDSYRREAPATEAHVRNTKAAQVPEETMKPKCAVCPSTIIHNNPHAVFCSSTCAARAATHYNAANTSLEQAITAEGEKYGKELTDTLHKQNEQWADNFRQHAKTADRALRFLCGLNLQDHPVKEQREALVIVRELAAALKPGKVGK
jgi:hypothetical protein